MSLFVPLIPTPIPRRAFMEDSRGVSAIQEGYYAGEVLPKTIGSIFPLRQPNQPKSGKRFDVEELTQKTN